MSADATVLQSLPKYNLISLSNYKFVSEHSGQYPNDASYDRNKEFIPLLGVPGISDSVKEELQDVPYA
ncbi:hypothetical protein TNIN_480511 [Trichonephila inaurata madagascariensis]|uniref:Uncharacterized protein n=1 Tax=Trichonephila inaurata madagascariensis TaxID=2747483 RepID=A0A8X6MIF9_9ARAC|nr:hypothetical protein TNIN_480511 [Trichonephila inaurata madagascariensis]